MTPPTLLGHDHRPDPFDLQVNAMVLIHRATLLGYDKATHDLLLRLSEDYWSEGQYLAQLAGAVPPWDRGGACVDFRQLVLDTWDPSIRSAVMPSTPFLETDEWVGLVQSTTKPLLGRMRHHFRLASHADAPRSRPRPSPAAARAGAVVELVQHADGRWQIAHAEVVQAHRRRGVLTMLYDRIEDFLNVGLRPSGWLTDDALWFWDKRQPDLIQAYSRHEEMPGLWLSPETRLDLLAVAMGKLLRRADESGPPN